MAFLDQLKDGARLVKETTSTVISEGKQNAENLRKKKEIQVLQNQINDLYRLEEIKENPLYSTEIAEITKLFQEQISLQKSIDSSSQDLVSCPHCGTSLSKTFEFCINCGKVVK